MTILPNPWLTDSTPRSAEKAAALSPVAPPCSAAAELIESALEPSRAADAAAGPGLTDPPVPAAVDLDGTDHIHEIFHYARKLLADHHAKHNRFVLDVPAFMEAIEPMPMFLQRTA